LVEASELTAGGWVAGALVESCASAGVAATASRLPANKESL